MKVTSMISIICYFLLFSVAFAYNVTMYSGLYYVTHNLKPIVALENRYEFEYNYGDELKLDIRLKNTPADVLASVSITNSTIPGNTVERTMTKCRNNTYCLSISDITLESEVILIGMQLKRGHVPCATQIILEGHVKTVSNRTHEHNDICLTPQKCVMEIELKNVCEVLSSSAAQPSSPSPSTSPSTKKVFIYVIPSVIVMCVMLLAIYLSIKKYCQRNSDLQTMELNTYSTANEVIYADLGFVHEGQQPPRRTFRPGDEQSPYAEIIGVLHPKD